MLAFPISPLEQHICFLRKQRKINFPMLRMLISSNILPAVAVLTSDEVWENKIVFPSIFVQIWLHNYVIERISEISLSR